MFEIDKSRGLHLTQKGAGSSRAVPTRINISCPNEACTSSFGNLMLEWASQQRFSYAYATCAVCGQVVQFFLVDESPTPHKGTVAQQRLLVIPPLRVRLPYPDNLKSLSPAFVEIATQAAAAELLGLRQLVGIGYRKALEFLIKDYLCALKPESVETIRKVALGKCIQDYVDDADIRECAARAAWLGNDETHYERVFSEHDIEDLKTLLDLTASWISKKLKTIQYMESMRARK